MVCGHGNYLVGLTFRRANEFRIDASPEDVIQLMLDAATDLRDEAAITAWLWARATTIGAP